MRSTSEVLRTFEETVGRYLIELENLHMEQLLKKVDEEEWSIGQMYMHLVQSAQFMHLHHADQCLSASEDTVDATGEKTERGKQAFELGSFPPVRVRVPASPQYTPQQPESKEQLTQGLLDVVERMKRIEPALSNASEGRKTLHPGLGALNAMEWFLLVEMHYRHHLLQLERLKTLYEITH